MRPLVNFAEHLHDLLQIGPGVALGRLLAEQIGGMEVGITGIPLNPSHLPRSRVMPSRLPSRKFTAVAPRRTMTSGLISSICFFR